jgi:hypothetical protein
MVLDDYRGDNLPAECRYFLEELENEHRFQISITGPSQKTIRIVGNGKKCGYVNSTIISNGLIVGMSFGLFGRQADSCPDEIYDTVVDIVSNKLACPAEDLVVMDGKGSNLGRRYLGVKQRKTALYAMFLASEEGEV